VNSAFHSAYDEARTRESRDGPVLAVMADKLILMRARGRAEYATSSDVVSVVKGIAHAPVAIFVTLYSLGDASLDTATLTSLAHLDAGLGASQLALRTLEATPDGVSAALACVKIVSPTRAFLRKVLEAGHVEMSALETLAEDVREGLYDCLRLASHIQLASLHARTMEVIRELDPWEHRVLQVVVAGDHQARRRSLPMQYFQKLFREPPGADVRVVYGEGIETADEALTLVGTKRLDLVIAEAFFREPRRLYRDVLGDEAQEQLRDFVLEPIA